MAEIEIAGRNIGPSHPVFIVAELSANHGHDYAKAEALVRAAKEAGADAVKVQCFDPNLMTLNLDSPLFRIESGPWAGYRLYSLYAATHMPWGWMPKLKDLAESLGMIWFSSAFDRPSIDFLESIGCPAYKVASFELVDLPLIRYVASKGKPVILSTGMATFDEIVEAVGALGEAPFALLKCVSGYPAPVADLNLRALQGINFARFGTVGLSDHSCSNAVVAAAVTLGACIVERHLKLEGEDGPDAEFSDTPGEFAAMVRAIRDVEAAMGEVKYGPSESERENLRFRRSLFVVRAVKAGDVFTPENVRSIRPASGLHPRYYEHIVGRGPIDPKSDKFTELCSVLPSRAARDIEAGEPLAWEMVEGDI